MLADKNFRRLLFAGMIALIIEFTIIYVVCFLLADRHESPLTYALIGLASLYVFRMANALIKMAVATAVYYLSKKHQADALVAMFYQHKIPVNEETAFAGGQGLLEAIAASQDASPAAKRFALVSIGEFSAISASNRPLVLMRLYAIFDAAWERYRAEVNAKAAA